MGKNGGGWVGMMDGWGMGMDGWEMGIDGWGMGREGDIYLLAHYWLRLKNDVGWDG